MKCPPKVSEDYRSIFVASLDLHNARVCRHAGCRTVIYVNAGTMQADLRCQMVEPKFDTCERPALNCLEPAIYHLLIYHSDRCYIAIGTAYHLHADNPCPRWTNLRRSTFHVFEILFSAPPKSQRGLCRYELSPINND